MQVARCDYFVGTELPKKNGEKLTSMDLINVGYMAGRYGVSLDGDLKFENKPKQVKDGLNININSCTKDLFEKNLTEAGIKFNVLA